MSLVAANVFLACRRHCRRRHCRRRRRRRRHRRRRRPQMPKKN